MLVCTFERMCVCKYVSIKVSKVCKLASWQVYKYACIQGSKNISLHVCQYAVKKQNLYYMFHLTFDRVNIPLQSMVNDVVENFFLHFYND